MNKVLERLLMVLVLVLSVWIIDAAMKDVLALNMDNGVVRSMDNELGVACYKVTNYSGSNLALHCVKVK